MKTTYLDKALAATAGTQFGAIIRCAYDLERDACPRFVGKASITSDGFVMCSFVDRHGEGHMGAFVGSARDLSANIAGLIRHCSMKADEAEAFRAKLNAWVATDYRSEKTLLGAAR